MVEESIVHVNEIATETESEDIKCTITSTKYKFYARYGEALVRYLMRNIYVTVERFIILGRPLRILS